MIQFFMGTTIGILLGIALSVLMVMAEIEERKENDTENRSN